MSGRYDETDAHYQRVLDLDRQAGDRAGQAHTHQQLAYLWERQRDLPRSLGHAEEALALYRQDGHERGEAIALGKVGWYQTLLGDHRRAVDLLRELGARYEQTVSLRHLGDLHVAAGDPEAARAAFAEALEVLADLDHPKAEAVRATLSELRH